MIEKLVRRGEEIAAAAQRRKLGQIAEQLRTLVGNSVHVEGAQVRVVGRGIISRWLVDPSLRFLGGGLK